MVAIQYGRKKKTEEKERKQKPNEITFVNKKKQQH